MTDVIRMPKMNLSMEEGAIVKWLVEEGAEVGTGDVVAEVETDKTVTPLTAPREGVIARLLIREGNTVKVGEAIAEWAGERGVSPAPASYTAAAQHAELPMRAPVAISPAARRRARELGIDYASIRGTGPRGRIVYRDVEHMASGPEHGLQSTPPLPMEFVERVALTPMRRRIAERMLESVQSIPQFSITLTVDIARLLAVKKAMEPSMEKRNITLSLTDFIVYAVSRSLVLHPAINASFVGHPADENSHILLHRAINIGLAVSVEGGVVVPVIRRADHMTVAEIASLRSARVAAARQTALDREQWQHGTFTVSNLGMYGVDEFRAIVNPPEAGILAVGAVRQLPYLAGGNIEFHPAMTLTGSFDHRAVDGAAAAAFMKSLASLLESDRWDMV